MIREDGLESPPPPPSSVLVPAWELPTEGVTDFESFEIDGAPFLVASNEQNESDGIDISSMVWNICAVPSDTSANDSDSEGDGDSNRDVIGLGGEL